MRNSTAMKSLLGPRRFASSFPIRVWELKDGGVWGTLAGQPTNDSELAWVSPGRHFRKGYTATARSTRHMWTGLKSARSAVK